MNPGERYDPLLTERWTQVIKEGCLRLETIETWIVYMCHSEGEWGKTKDVSAFEQEVVVGARRTGLNLSRTAVFFHAQQFPV